MTSALSDPASLHWLQILMVGLGAAIVALGIWQSIRLHRQNKHLTVAMDNMAQGLCLWSPSAKLVLSNRRYAEMYELSPQQVRPGISLREVLQHRVDAGNFSGDLDQYIAELIRSIKQGKTVTGIREHKGQHIAIVNAPLEGGGWVATHEDITARRQADRQRLAMK